MSRIISGPNAVEEFIKAGKAKPDEVYILSGLSQKTAARIYSLCEKHKITATAVSKDKLDALSKNEIHQGVIAIAGEFNYTPFENILKKSKSLEKSVIVILDQVQDPGNLGAIIRSSKGLGANGVIITKHRSAQMTSGAVRASAGASELIPVAAVINLVNAIEQLKEEGFTIFGADGKADLSIETIKWPDKTVIIMGNEAKGLRLLTRQNCDHLFKIPITDFESLNVSAAAAISLYQVKISLIN
ncbi:MAG: 23S rRNA (guanosine(2251)-2'-O)-methyltransferase RlmB [Deltaproteobacteria bacterium]|nr:23S rRNA (guanosine(2251)-2'-O)-methyltransferase RlmB [Deltaproteobacteria bacterium]